MTRRPLHSLVLQTAALLVPREHRRDWLAEWTSELWYVSRRPLRFCLGSFRDALWLRQSHGTLAPRLQSPLKCLVFLLALAALAAVFFFRTPGPYGEIVRACRRQPAILLTHLLVAVLAFLIVSALTPTSHGEYPQSGRIRRGAFLTLQFVLLVPLVFWGTFDLAKLLSASGLQPHASLIGYAVAFRWALNDQRRRCPVCLRRLSGSASIGHFAHNFLEWYGTELFCLKGHGLLHVPEIATTYSTRRWLDLDRSWSTHFS